MAVKVGGADGGYTKKKQFKIKDGNNVYRILPSLGFNGKEPNGRWSKFYRIHFGYKNAEGKIRVFESPLEKNKEKMVTTPDAALERLDQLKAKLAEAKASNNKAVYDRLLPLVATAKPLYNLDSNHYMNVISETGEIGVLKLRHRGKLMLDAVIKDLRAKGIEPLGVETGRYFVINRTGSALDTTYSVTVKTRTLQVKDVGEVEQPIVHVLTSEIINRLEAEASDLDNLYIKPTAEEVAQIVAETDLSTGICKNIETILGRKKAEVEEADENDAGDEETAQAATTQTQAAASTQTPAQNAAASLTTTPASTPPVQIQAPAPQKPAVSVASMTDDEFLASLR